MAASKGTHTNNRSGEGEGVNEEGQEDDGDEDGDEEEDMMALMGFSGFDTTKVSMSLPLSMYLLTYLIT